MSHFILRRNISTPTLDLHLLFALSLRLGSQEISFRFGFGLHRKPNSAHTLRVPWGYPQKNFPAFRGYFQIFLQA